MRSVEFTTIDKKTEFKPLPFAPSYTNGLATTYTACVSLYLY